MSSETIHAHPVGNPNAKGCFCDVISGADTKELSTEELERRIRWELEGHSPVPLESLAYGWVRFKSGSVFYYATPFLPADAATDRRPPGACVPDWETLGFPEGLTESDWAEAEKTDYADVRDRQLLAELRRAEWLNRLLLRLRPVLIGGVAVLFVLWAVVGIFSLRTAWIEKRLRDTDVAAQEAKSAEDMLNGMTRFSSERHSLFDLLAVLNGHRPAGMSFSHVEFAGPTLVIEGRAAEVRQVNAYAETLRGTGVFSSVELPKLDATRGAAVFRLKLTPSRWPAVAPAKTVVSEVRMPASASVLRISEPSRA